MRTYSAKVLSAYDMAENSAVCQRSACVYIAKTRETSFETIVDNILSQKVKPTKQRE